MTERDLADALRKLADLRGAGAISADDFHRAKTRLLTPPVGPSPDPEYLGSSVSPHHGDSPRAAVPSGGRVGAVLVALGGVLTLGAFLFLPIAAVPFVGPITGADLATLTNGPRSFALLWLVPVGAAALVAVAAWGVLLGSSTGRGWAVTAVCVSATLLIGHLAAFVLVLREDALLAPDDSTPGYWIAALGCAVAVVGGALALPWPSVVPGAVGGLAVLAGLTAAAVALVPSLGAVTDVGTSSAAPASRAAAPATIRPDASARPFPTTPPRAVSAQDTLDQIVAADRAAVDALEGAWVPQLWSKRAGLVADGIVYDVEDILASYRDLLDRRPGAALLRSDDYGSFRSGGFYVAVMPLTFDTGQDALAWCASEGLGRNDCIAKRILRNGSPEGNAMYPP